MASGGSVMAAKGTPEKTWLVAKLAIFLFVPLILAAQSLDVLEQERSFCLFKTFLGHECWGCGLFKATVACLKLDFVRAFHYNKLIVIVFPLIVFYWVKELILMVKGLVKK